MADGMQLPQVTLDLARRALDQGDPRRCETLCDRMSADGSTNVDIADVDIECLRGESFLAREGRAADAQRAFEAALRLEPGSARARNGVILSLLRLGQLEQAHELLAGAVEGDGDAETLHGLRQVIERLTGAEVEVPPRMNLLLGQALNGMRRFDEAEDVLSAFIDQPGNDGLDAYLALTRTYGGMGRIDEILDACRRLRDAAIWAMPSRRRLFLDEIEMLVRSLDQVRPDHPLTLAVLGTVLVEKTASYSDGVALLNHVNEVAPNIPDLYLGAGLARLLAGDFGEAELHLGRAMAGMENFREPEIFSQLIEITKENRDFKISEFDPMPAAALLVFAESLAGACRLPVADRVIMAAVEKAPEVPEVHTLHAAVLFTIGRSEEALAAALRARASNPDDASANLEVATNLMALGRLGEAWDIYDHRLSCWRRDTETRTFPVPQWKGEPLNGRTLLVWREEGLGDEIRFSSLFPDLKKMADCRLIIECGPRLKTLFERSFPDISFRAENIADSSMSGIDLHIPIMSLPQLFRRRIDDFPRAQSFLTPDPDRVLAWRNRLSSLGERPLIGIGWRSLNQSWRKQPLLTTLADWDGIIGREDLSIINLQCEDFTEEVVAAEARLGRSIYVVEDIDLKNDIEEAAALMAALDVVVGARCWVPTTAAAVGTKAFCVTPRPNPFMMNLPYDPWSGTMDVLYRDQDEGWGRVIDEVGTAMDAYLSDRRGADNDERPENGGS